MKVYVNDKPVDVLPGMTVRHALIQGGLLEKIACGEKVYDEWDHEMGQDGELADGIRLYLR